jgi:hypothetical protein
MNLLQPYFSALKLNFNRSPKYSKSKISQLNRMMKDRNGLKFNTGVLKMQVQRKTS